MSDQYARVSAQPDDTKKWRGIGMLVTFGAFVIVAIGVLTTPFYQNPLPSELFKYEVTNPEAVCNDGSPSIVYVRKTHTKKWLIYVEGGILYCWDKATCDTRRAQHPELMSSDDAPDSLDPTGLMSSDCALNPDWCDANIGYIYYCSSDYFTGTVKDSDAGVHFQGWEILQSAVSDLLTIHGMDAADTVLYTGKGGGGVAALITVDRIVEQIRDGLKDRLHADVRSFTDSGWVSAREPYSPRECDGTDDATTCNIAGGVQRGVEAWLPEYPDYCTEHGWTWECYFANYTFTHIETPSFVFNYQYDYAQLDTDGLTSFHGTYNDEAGVAWAQEQAEYLVNTEIINNGAANYIFLPGCWDHEIMDKDVLNDVYIDEHNLVAAMREWYRGLHTIMAYDDDFVMNSNPTCLNIR